MEKEGETWDLLDQVYETSVNPERLDELVSLWDERIYTADPDRAVQLADFSDLAMSRHLARAFEILGQLQTQEFEREQSLLADIRSAAMILSDTGDIIGANDTARFAFGILPGGSIRDLPVEPEDLEDLGRRLGALTEVDPRADAVARLRALGAERVVLVHLRPMKVTRGRPRILAVTSEHVWPVEASDLLARVFGLTPAEIDVMRQLTAGGTVAGIARAGGRSAVTVRSQLASIFAKTGADCQAEVVRLGSLLIQSVRTETDPVHPGQPGGPRHRALRMRDGRRIEIFILGDPRGRPVIWTQSTLGFFRLPRAAETDLVRRGLRVIVPVRAGYGKSDPAPPDRDNFELAVEDMRDLMDLLGVDRAPVVAPTDDIRLALMFAKAEPGRVTHAFGLGSCFPILNKDQYRRMHSIGRFFRACARYAPVALPFLAKAFRSVTLRFGVERYLRSAFSSVPVDARAIEDREVIEAVVAGYSYVIGMDAGAEVAFCAELEILHRDWPEGLGHVACPVTLIHGEKDGNAPHETVRDYCAMHPAWRYVGFPEEGQLVTYVRWREVLDLVEGAVQGRIPAAEAVG